MDRRDHTITPGQVNAAICAVLEASQEGGSLGSSGDSEQAERHLLHDIGLYLEYQYNI